MEPGDLVRRDTSWAKTPRLDPGRLFLTKLPDLPSGDNVIVGEVKHQLGLVLAIVTTNIGGDHLFDFALVQMGPTFGWVFADELEVV